MLAFVLSSTSAFAIYEVPDEHFGNDFVNGYESFCDKYPLSYFCLDFTVVVEKKSPLWPGLLNK
jgi:hypothetical protein